MPAAFIERISEPRIKDFYHFWKARRRDSEVPLKRSFDPTSMPPAWLPRITIYQWLGEKFLIRLVGTYVVDIDGSDPTGRFLEDILPPAMAEQRHAMFRAVLTRSMPAYYRGIYNLGDTGRKMPFERLLLPVSASGGEADHIMAMITFDQQLAPRRGFSMAGSMPEDLEVIWAE